MQLLLLLLGIFACSTSVVFITGSNVDPVLLAALRVVVAVAALAPVYALDFRRHRSEMTWRHARDSAIPGVMLSLHFITWLIGARMTPWANSTLIVNIVPVVMPVLLWALVRERVTRWELLATMVSAGGILLLMASDYQISPAHFRGDVVCFVSMLMLAAYMAMGRKYRHHPTVWLYVVPLYAASAVVSFVAALFLADWSPIDWPRELPYILALGLIPTVIGHSLINVAMRHFRGQVVSLLVMLQFVFAGLLAYVLEGVAPDWTFFPASAAVVAGGVMVAMIKPPAPQDAS